LVLVAKFLQEKRLQVWLVIDNRNDGSGSTLATGARICVVMPLFRSGYRFRCEVPQNR
jgi:hypothetical protein